MAQNSELESIAAEPPYDAVLRAIRHGTHVCAFYETEEDLLDLVGQFCAAGARRGDLCLWMMPEGVNSDLLASAGVELHSGEDAYQKGGSFESGPMVAFWHEKLAQALAQNHTGLCASGHTRWLQQRDWQAFMEYENYLKRHRRETDFITLHLPAIGLQSRRHSRCRSRPRGCSRKATEPLGGDRESSDR